MAMYLLTRNEVQYRINLVAESNRCVISMDPQDISDGNVLPPHVGKLNKRVNRTLYSNQDIFEDANDDEDSEASQKNIDFIKNILITQEGDKLENLENLESNDAKPMSEDDQKTYENEVLNIFPDLKDKFQKSTTYKLTRDHYTYTILFEKDKEGMDICKIILNPPISDNLEKDFKGMSFESNSLDQRVYSSEKAENISFIGNILTFKKGDNLEKVEGTERVTVVEKSKIKNTEEFDVYHNKSLKIIYVEQEKVLKKYILTQRYLNILSFLTLALVAAVMLAITILTAGAAAGVFVPGAIGFLAVVGATSAAVGSTAAFTLFTIGAIGSAILTGLSLFAAVKVFHTDPAQPSSPSEKVGRENPGQFKDIIEEIPKDPLPEEENLSQTSFLDKFISLFHRPNSTVPKKDKKASIHDDHNISEEEPKDKDPSRLRSIYDDYDALS